MSGCQFGYFQCPSDTRFFGGQTLFPPQLPTNCDHIILLFTPRVGGRLPQLPPLLPTTDEGGSSLGIIDPHGVAHCFDTSQGETCQELGAACPPSPLLTAVVGINMALRGFIHTVLHIFIRTPLHGFIHTPSLHGFIHTALHGFIHTSLHGFIQWHYMTSYIWHSMAPSI